MPSLIEPLSENSAIMGEGGLAEKRPPLSTWLNTCWSLVGTGAGVFIQGIILILFAKLTNPESLGQYAFALALVTPVMNFSQMQLRQLVVTDSANTHHFQEYFSLRIIGVIFAFLVLLILVSVTGKSISSQTVLLLVVLWKCIDSISDLIQGSFQKEQRMDRIAVSLLIKAISISILLPFILLITKNIQLALLIIVGSYSAVLVFYEWRFVKDIIHTILPSVNLKRLYQNHILRLGLPLAFSGVLASLSANMPYYFLVRYYGSKAAGFFSAAMTFYLVSGLVNSAVSQAILPQVSEELKSSTCNQKTTGMPFYMAWSLIGIQIMGFMLFVLNPGFFMRICFTREYVQYAPAAGVLLGAGVVQSTGLIASMLVVATRRPHLQIISAVISLLFQLIALPFFIGRSGVWGAAISELWRAVLVGVMLTVFAISYLNGKNLRRKVFLKREL